MIRIPTHTQLLKGPLHYAEGFLSGEWWILGNTAEGTPPHDFLTKLAAKAYAKAGATGQPEWSFDGHVLIEAVGRDGLEGFMYAAEATDELRLDKAQVQWGVGANSGRIAALTVRSAGGDFVDLDPMWAMLCREWGATIYAPTDCGDGMLVCAIEYEGERVGALMPEQAVAE